jgi:hypothetical protein
MLMGQTDGKLQALKRYRAAMVGGERRRKPHPIFFKFPDAAFYGLFAA